MKEGGVLMKLGLIRVSLNPKPIVNPFQQTLQLRHGEIAIRLGEGTTAIDYRIWVDANHPVIRVEANGSQPFKTTVTIHDWRLRQGDTILAAPRAPTSPAPRAADPNRSAPGLTWFHHNPSKNDPRLADPHLADITFGATLEGPGLVRDADSTLTSGVATSTQLISIHPLTLTGPAGCLN